MTGIFARKSIANEEEVKPQMNTDYTEKKTITLSVFIREIRGK